jgi:hypothetical protein
MCRCVMAACMCNPLRRSVVAKPSDQPLGCFAQLCSLPPPTRRSARGSTAPGAWAGLLWPPWPKLCLGTNVTSFATRACVVRQATRQTHCQCALFCDAALAPLSHGAAAGLSSAHRLPASTAVARLASAVHLCRGIQRPQPVQVNPIGPVQMARARCRSGDVAVFLWDCACACVCRYRCSTRQSQRLERGRRL